ncbi:MAG: hypothetical protein ABSF43_15785 [Rectinemataceae bacterium]|jgi:hypothetical protein
MPLKVTLIEDPIRKDGSTIPRVVQRNKVGFEKLLSYMSKTTRLTETDIRSIFLQFAEALVFWLPDGSEVQTPLGAFTLSVSQSVSEDSTSMFAQTQIPTFNPADMRIRIRSDRGLLERIQIAAAVQIIDTPALSSPVVKCVENADLEGSINTGVPGQILHITGSRLSFDRGDQEQGAFLISASTQVATRVVVYSHIGSSFVDCKIPQIDKGDYSLEMRNRPTGKAIRTGAYKNIITVN